MSDSAALTEFDWDVRTHIYRSFAESGQAPTLGAIAAGARSTENRVQVSLQKLFEAHEIAPLPDGRGIWMANPFSGIPTDYVVTTPEMTCYANCAWDALGVPAILGTDGWTRTKCAESGTALEFGILDGILGGDDGVIHLVTPLRRAWEDIGFT